MRRFLVRLSLFILLFAFVVFCYHWLYFNHRPVKPDVNKTILIIGDSHTECAVDDSVFNRGLNLSYSGTGYIQSYLKLKEVCEYQKIDTVILSFWQRSLCDSADDFDLQNGHLFFPYWSGNEAKIYLSHYRFYKELIESPMSVSNAIYDLGSFYRNDRDIKTFLKKKQDSGKDPDGENHYGNKYSIMYLKKIAALCQAKGIKLILLSTPMWNYRNKEIDRNSEFYTDYEKYFGEIEFRDYSCMKLPEEYYADDNHLNYKGAKLFSEYLLKELRPE